MLYDDETLEILSPNPVMAALISDLKTAMTKFPEPESNSA